MRLLANCQDCGAAPGDQHRDGCDTEICPDCGRQMLLCEQTCTSEVRHPRIVWSGKWPGQAECEEYDYWSYWIPGMGPPTHGHLRCSRGTAGAGPDLNRLGLCQWDAEQAKHVPRVQAPAVHVINKRTTPIPAGAEYIGRPGLLSNGYVIGRDGDRNEVIVKYVHNLSMTLHLSPVREEFVRLVDIARCGPLTLVCHCEPEHCHGHVLKTYIERAVETERLEHDEAAE